jgi:hypothetical protein
LPAEQGARIQGVRRGNPAQAAGGHAGDAEFDAIGIKQVGAFPFKKGNEGPPHISET